MDLRGDWGFTVWAMKSSSPARTSILKLRKVLSIVSSLFTTVRRALFFWWERGYGNEQLNTSFRSRARTSRMTWPMRWRCARYSSRRFKCADPSRISLKSYSVGKRREKRTDMADLGERRWRLVEQLRREDGLEDLVCAAPSQLPPFCSSSPQSPLTCTPVIIIDRECVGDEIDLLAYQELDELGGELSWEGGSEESTLGGLEDRNTGHSTNLSRRHRGGPCGDRHSCRRPRRTGPSEAAARRCRTPTRADQPTVVRHSHRPPVVLTS